MKLYWRTKDIPELAGLSWIERTKVLRRCQRKVMFRDRQCRVGLVIMSTLAVLGVITGDTGRYVFGLPTIVQCACWFIGAGTGYLIYRSILVDRLRPHLRDYLTDKRQHS